MNFLRSKLFNRRSAAKKIPNFVTTEPYTPSDVFVSGYGWDGQLCCDSVREGGPKHEPVRIEKFCLEPVKDVSLGLYHVLVLSEQGICYSWGSDYQFQLGHSTAMIAMPSLSESVCEPELVDGSLWEPSGRFYEMKELFKGMKHSNSNDYDETKEGIGGKSIFCLKHMPMGSIAAIASGFFHNAVITRKGVLWTWGSGFLGNGSDYFSCVPVRINDFFKSGLPDSTIRVYCRGVWAAGHYTIALVTPKIGSVAFSSSNNVSIQKYLECMDLKNEDEQLEAGNDSAPRIVSGQGIMAEQSEEEGDFVLNENENDIIYIWGLLPSPFERKHRLEVATEPEDPTATKKGWLSSLANSKSFSDDFEKEQKSDEARYLPFYRNLKCPSNVFEKSNAPIPVTYLSGGQQKIHRICPNFTSFLVLATPNHSTNRQEILIFGAFFDEDQAGKNLSRPEDSILMTISPPFFSLFPNRKSSYNFPPSWTIPLSIFEDCAEQLKNEKKRRVMSGEAEGEGGENSNFSASENYYSRCSQKWKVRDIEAGPNFYIVSFCSGDFFTLSSSPSSNHSIPPHSIVWESNIEGVPPIYVTRIDSLGNIPTKPVKISVSLDSITVLDEEGSLWSMVCAGGENVLGHNSGEEKLGSVHAKLLSKTTRFVRLLPPGSSVSASKFNHVHSSIFNTISLTSNERPLLSSCQRIRNLNE